ncbi:hypothetical protein [Amycolatopsis eburnea]|uniref:Uncharacterized protein n=1 Tax=Amycolatopsis eburnea TaxID=2267691 RepID=A0A3R9EL30_9PSEU|nr:hypothetical protein [Amycolatopsis eburnea]RSD10281.1 hypothetical protein EIY87_35940 [Amycolatopsis eburnea]
MRETTPTLKAVEWVTNHGEAHGQLLVRGSTLDEIIRHARAELGSGRVRLKIHPGWWRTERCRCRRTLASSNHPAWHYHPAAATDPSAWRGAEVRLVLASRC